MSSAIVSFLLKQGGGYLWNHIKAAAFGKAADQMADLRKSQETMLQDLRAMHLEALIWMSIEKIVFWTKQMEVANRKEDAERKKVGPLPPKPFLTKEMNNLVAALEDMGDGVAFHMDNIFSVLVGKNALVGKDGFVGAWNKLAYVKLANMTDMNYNIKDFLEEIDKNIASIAKILSDGCILRSVIAADDKERESWAKESADNIVTAQDKAYELFPTALRKLKPSYSADFISEMHWWRFQYRDKPQRYLSLYDGTPYRGYPIENFPTKGAWCEFRFAGSFPKDGLVSIRIRLGDDRFGVQTDKRGIFAVNADGAYSFEPLLFKVVPLLDAKEPAIKFSIKRASSATTEAENGQWTYFGTALMDTFILDDDGIVQDGKFLPAKEAPGCVIC